MKSFIAVLVLAFAFTLGTNSFAQDKEKTTTTTTTNTVVKDGKTTKNITKKISKSKMKCDGTGCCSDKNCKMDKTKTDKKEVK
jgi:hypothetical protein